MKLYQVILFILLFPIGSSYGQFYTELFSMQRQQLSTVNSFNQGLSNTSVNVLAPLVKTNGDVFLIRGSFDQLHLSNNTQDNMVWSLSMPLGYQWQSRKKSSLKWTALVVPKWAAGNERKFDQGDAWQYGLYSLATWTQRPELKFKFGLYVNQEFFGTFVVPLAGIDWKVNDRLQIFGTLPNSLKVFFQCKPNRWNVALVFKSVTRSFRVAQPDAYVRFNEVEAKALLECVLGKSVIQCEGGYFFGGYPKLFGNDNVPLIHPLYGTLKPSWVVNLGYAFRISQ